MSSPRHQNHRRRSHSATTLSPGARTPVNPWRVATKRAYPHSFSVKSDASSSPKCDKDIGKRSKRRRQDILSSPFVLDDRHSSAVQPKSPFATKASDFHLFTRRDTKIRRRSTHFTDARSMDIDFDDEHANLRNISRLRSNAFWELHRSVAENGEGLVRRMRDYEHSRSRTDVYLKAKEAQKRGRKRSSVINLARRVQHVRLHSDSDHGDDEEEDDEEDDEVQIFAGELPRLSLAGMHYPPKRSMSLDVKDTSGRGCQLATNRRYSRRGSSPPFIHLEREELSPGTISSPTPIPSSGSRTEKAIAALSLAMANGAGGITDYGSVLSVASNLPLHDECQVGEMWD